MECLRRTPGKQHRLVFDPAQQAWEAYVTLLQAAVGVEDQLRWQVDTKVIQTPQRIRASRKGGLVLG